MFTRRLASAVLVMLSIVAAPMPRLQADVEQSQAALNAAYDSLKTALAARFGPNWTVESLPEEIAQELHGLAAAVGELRYQRGTLDVPRAQLAPERADLERRRLRVDAHRQALDDREAELAARDKSWEGRSKAWGQRADQRKASPCMAERPSQCAAFIEEGRRMEVERQALRLEGASLERDHASLDGERRDAVVEASNLKETSDLVEIHAWRVAQREGDFLARSGGAAIRARALLEVLKNPRFAGGAEAGPSIAEQQARGLRSIGQEVAVQAFRLVIWEQPYIGASFVVADMLKETMDERAKEVAGHTLLLADYAIAMQRLKRDGQLRPGEPGFEALRQMNAELGHEMPHGNTSFVWQSLTASGALGHGLVAAVSLYTIHTSEHVSEDAAKAVFKQLSKEEKAVHSAQAMRFFKGAVKGLIAGGPPAGVDALFKDAGAALEAQRLRDTDAAFKNEH